MIALAPGDLHGQATGGDGFQAYALQHALAADIEPQLTRLLAGLPTPTEVVADPKSNRLLVRGTPAARELVTRLIAALDRPQTATNTTQLVPVGGPNGKNIRAAMQVIQ